MRAHTQGTSRVLLIMGFAVLAAAMLVLSGCGVTNREILKAQELCKDHGGVGVIWTDRDGVDVTCANGTRIAAKL